MQKFIEGVRNFELKRNLALMYAQEQYVEAPPTVEALRFTVQQYLRMCGSNRSDNYQMAQPQHPQPQQPNQQPKLPQAIPPPIPQPQQIPPPQQPAPYRPQPQRACFNCGDPSHFVIDCPLKDRAQETGTATSKFLSHQPFRWMDLSITTPRSEQRSVPSIPTNPKNCSFLCQLWVCRTFRIGMHIPRIPQTRRTNKSSMVCNAHQSVRWRTTG